MTDGDMVAGGCIAAHNLQTDLYLASVYIRVMRISTAEVTTTWLLPEMATRVAAMLNYFLDHLAGGATRAACATTLAGASGCSNLQMGLPCTVAVLSSIFSLAVEHSCLQHIVPLCGRFLRKKLVRCLGNFLWGCSEHPVRVMPNASCQTAPCMA